VTEKDRLGAKLRDKGRGEEERYFAERDRLLIARLREAREAEQEQAVRELARFRCPKCGARLAERLFHGVTIDECAECGGLWLDRGELRAVARRNSEGWIASFLEGLRHLLEPPER
jgi:ribosomal protein L37AE/L43A